MAGANTDRMDEILLSSAERRFAPVFDGIQASLLFSSSETGRWTVIFRCEKGSFFPRHKHYGPGEYYVVRGRMEYVSGVAETGTYGYEPLGAVHDMTSFTEETELFFTNHGPVAFLTEDDQVLAMFDNAFFEGIDPA
jgi:anti-sigma factor ChrR (cupin superfamily)